MKTTGNKVTENPVSEIRIRLLPGSSMNRITGREEDVYRIKVTAPPNDGKANKGLIRLLSKQLGTARGNIEIVSGKLSRNKTVRIAGLTEDEIIKRMKG